MIQQGQKHRRSRPTTRKADGQNDQRFYELKTNNSKRDLVQIAQRPKNGFWVHSQDGDEQQQHD